MLAGILSIALIAWTLLVFNAGGDYKVAAHEKAQAEADALIEQQAEELTAKEAEKIIDMQAAFHAGEANAKVVTKTVYVKGQSYVASTPVFQNRDCVIPADGVQLLNSQITDLQTTAAASVLGLAVYGSQPTVGRTDGDAVPPRPTDSAAVPGVRPEVPKPDLPAGAAGPSVRDRPKPNPVK
jgi:hypothetical protein